MTCPNNGGSNKESGHIPVFCIVIPVKTGIRSLNIYASFLQKTLDPRLRGDDTFFVLSFPRMRESICRNTGFLPEFTSYCDTGPAFGDDGKKSGGANTKNALFKKEGDVSRNPRYNIGI